MKNHLYYLLGLFCLGTLMTVQAAPTNNLLQGDADVELEFTAMTNGAYTNSFPSNPHWKHDTTQGYQSRSSIRIFRKGTGVGVKTLHLPKGTYTYSFYAKADKEGQTGYIAVHAVNDGWPVVLRRRTSNPITLSTKWKRYSYTFEADGQQLYSPYYSNNEAGVNFDRFMLNKGKKALPWVSTAEQILALHLPSGTGYVYPLGKKIPVTVTFSSSSAKRSDEVISLQVTDFTGKKVLSRQFKVRNDGKSSFRRKITLDLKKSGYFRICAFGKDKRSSASVSLVIARPPEKTIPQVEPFVGLCSAQNQLEAAKLLGVKWLQYYLSWYTLENVKGRYDFRGMEKMKKYKAMGFKLQALVTSGPPAWALSPEVNKAIRKLNVNHYRCVADIPMQEKYYRPLVREFARRYKGLFDIYELGGELDALLGLNVYYKGRDNKNMVGPFVLGESFEKACHMMEIAAQEILKTDPKARISSVRPSDVDARYAYIYSKEVFKRLGKYMTCFGIDCYPQPRWIGPGQPPSGTEQDLAIRLRDSRNAMKGYVRGRDVMISEYGYFIDHKKIHDPEYMPIHVNRIARSFLKARLIGMKSLHYFTTSATTLEGKRYYMGVWYQGYPMAAAASLNSVGRVVENVVECREIRHHEKMGLGVFRKYDGRAVAALWSIDDKFNPLVEIDADSRLIVTDVMGNPVKLPVKKGKIQLQLSPLPYYIWRKEKGSNNYAVLSSCLQKLQVVEKVPLEIQLRMASKNSLKVHLKNSSLTRNVKGSLQYKAPAGGTQRKSFVVKKNSSDVVLIELPAEGKSIEGIFRFPGYEDYKISFTTPELIRVKRIRETALGNTLGPWRGVKPVRIEGKDHIHPVDHTTYDGIKDLSADLYLAHDTKYLYFAAAVTDDRHFNKFTLSRVWRGDCIQLGLDPEVNFLRKGNGVDKDDHLLSAGLLKSGPVLEVYRGSRRFEMQQKTQYRVLRNEKKKETLYLMKIPLQTISPLMKEGKIFNFNCIFMDDDTNSGADYWLFLRQGLAGGLRPDKWAPCILE